MRSVPSHRRGKMKKFAFTLAEVLITLGIIGIVAALTMPVLIEHHQKQVIETKLKSFYSIMNEAIQMSAIEEGGLDELNMALARSCSNTTSSSIECNKSIYERYFKNYLKSTSYIDNPAETDFFAVNLANGSIAKFSYNCRDIILYINKNALKNKKLGKNCFYFAFYTTGASGNRNIYFKGKGMEPYVSATWDGTPEGLYNSSHNATKIIQLNDWKIPKDYPFWDW